MRNGLGEVYSTATRSQINFIKFEIHAGILIWTTNILLGVRTTTATTTTTPMRYLNFHQELSRRSS